MPTARLGCGHGIAWTVLLATADTSSAGPKCPSSRVLHGSGALAKPGAKRQTQEGIAGWPGFDPDFAEEPGLIEPYLSAIRSRPHSGRTNAGGRADEVLFPYHPIVMKPGHTGSPGLSG